jgi:DNA (cytosine-5)-methyltransferase 1
VRIGSLFAGIGGFDLAARWMGWETAWVSEIDPYASAVLTRHGFGPNLGDITQIDFTQTEPVDLLCGGFPCQDLSLLGNVTSKRKGLSGERSGLWSEYARAVRCLQPRWVVIENVPALLDAGFDVVRCDLRTAGYRVARPVVMSASAVGAPHLRERLWVVAHTDRQGWERPWQTRSGGLIAAAGYRPEGVCVPSWEAPDPAVLHLVDGLPRRMVERGIRGFGNAIVPQCALAIFQAIQSSAEGLRAAA